MTSTETLSMPRGSSEVIKLLTWDINDCGLHHKVIESRETFHWPRLFTQDVVEMSKRSWSDSRPCARTTATRLTRTDPIGSPAS